MKRNLYKLCNDEYDVLVIGSGIYGVCVAWDAALRGLKVAVIDKGDFAGATSSNSMKTIHGGLRYIQHLDIKRMRESIHERKVLMKIAPYLVFPLPVIMPTYGYKFKSRLALFMALLANDLIGFNRNMSSDPDKYLPNGRLVSKGEFNDLVPGYDKENMSGGAVWYDCQCHNTERLVMAYALAASEKGANIANYVECIGLIVNGKNVDGVEARDFFNGDRFNIRSRVVINAAGPWIDRILDKCSLMNVEKRFIHSSAMNIIVRKNILNGAAAGLPGPYRHERDNGAVFSGSQILFFVPWRNYTIIGTRHLEYTGNPSEYKVNENDIVEFLDIVNKTYPAAAVKREDVVFFHGGLLPMEGVEKDSGKVRLQNRYKIYDHEAEDGIKGIITVSGVKYTTHRDVAGKTVDKVFQKLGMIPSECKTAKTPVYGGDISNFKKYLDAESKQSCSDANVVSHLVYTYGSKYKDILKYGEQDPEHLRIVRGTEEVLQAEVVNSVRNEMAMKLSDVILRRTDIGSAERPADETLYEVAEIMAKELAWNRSKINDEIDEVSSCYTPAH